MFKYQLTLSMNDGQIQFKMKTDKKPPRVMPQG